MTEPETQGTHETHRTLCEDVIYPDHPQRTESAEFSHNKRLLVKQLDVPCWICGSRENREVHHYFVEWALFEDVCPEKLLDAVHQFDPYGFGKKMADQPIETPDDIRNLLVLCAGHHREVEQGIHVMTHPIWHAQKIVRDGIKITDLHAKLNKAHGVTK